MKKIIFSKSKKQRCFLFAALCCFSFGFSVSAQQPGALSVIKEIDADAIPYMQQIVKINKDSTIVLSQKAANNRYALYLVGVNANTAIEAEIPSDFEIKDIAYKSNSIYFCGRKAKIQGGFIGFLASATVNDLFYNSNFVWDTINSTSSIDKLVVYDTILNKVGPEIFDTVPSIDIKIAAIGKDILDKSVFLYCNQVNNWNYSIFNSFVTTEVFDDILLSDAWIAIVGRQSAVTDRIVVRRYEQGNINNSTHGRLQTQNGYIFNQPFVVEIFDRTQIVATTVSYNNITSNYKTVMLGIDLDYFIQAPYIFMKNPWDYGNYFQQGNIRDLAFDSQDTINYRDNYIKLYILEDVLPFENSVFLFAGRYYRQGLDVFSSDVSGINYKFNGIDIRGFRNFVASGINPKTNKLSIWDGDISSLGGQCNRYNTETHGYCNVFEQDIFDSWEPTTQISIGPLRWKASKSINTPLKIKKICN